MNKTKTRLLWTISGLCCLYLAACSSPTGPGGAAPGSGGGGNVGSGYTPPITVSLAGINEEDIVTRFDAENKTIDIKVPLETDLTSLGDPIITITGAAVSSPDKIITGPPRIYTYPVTEDGNTAIWTVTVRLEPISISDPADIAGAIEDHIEDNSSANPVPLPLAIDLSGDGWRNLLQAIEDIEDAGVNVALDLTDCTMDGMTTIPGEFDPDNAITTGKGKIVSLVLPTAAESVKAGANPNLTFRYFTFLKEVNAVAVESIGDNAFVNCTALTTASFPRATTIGDYAFFQCIALETAYFPKAINIGNNAFTFCSTLTTVDFPEATNTGNDAFTYCRALTTASFPRATTIGGWAFQSCTALETVDFPRAITISGGAFTSCTALETAEFPEVTSIGQEAFGATALTTADFPEVTAIGDQAFRDCTSLTTVKLPAATSIGGQVFRDTGTRALTVTLGETAPALGVGTFYLVALTKNVTVQVPSGASGYGSSPTNTAPNWGNGFRGGGWTGAGFGSAGLVNTKINLRIEYQP
jgi:hypothetical protein